MGPGGREGRSINKCLPVAFQFSSKTQIAKSQNRKIAKTQKRKKRESTLRFLTRKGLLGAIVKRAHLNKVAAVGSRKKMFLPKNWVTSYKSFYS